MMKKILLILMLLFCYQLSYADDFLLKVLKQMNLNEADIGINLYVEAALPYAETKTVMVIPQHKTGEKEGIHIAVVNNADAKIVEWYYEEKAWSSDLPMLVDIIVDTTSYMLNDKTPAFGVIFHYTMASRVNPLEITELSLFVSDNKQLRNVLKDYPIYQYVGETNDNDICACWYFSVKSAVKIEKDGELVVNDKMTYSYGCDEKIKFSERRFKFNGSEYVFKEKNIYELMQEFE